MQASQKLPICISHCACSSESRALLSFDIKCWNRRAAYIYRTVVHILRPDSTKYASSLNGQVFLLYALVCFARARTSSIIYVRGLQSDQSDDNVVWNICLAASKLSCKKNLETHKMIKKKSGAYMHGDLNCYLTKYSPLPDLGPNFA